jgi:hypothetical protein
MGSRRQSADTVPTADTAKPWNVFAQMDMESPFQLEDDVQVQWEK